MEVSNLMYAFSNGDVNPIIVIESTYNEAQRVALSLARNEGYPLSLIPYCMLEWRDAAIAALNARYDTQTEEVCHVS